MSRPEGAVWRAPHFCERVGLRKIENLALSGNPYDRARRIPPKPGDAHPASRGASIAHRFCATTAWEPKAGAAARPPPRVPDDEGLLRGADQPAVAPHSDEGGFLELDGRAPSDKPNPWRRGARGTPDSARDDGGAGASPLDDIPHGERDENDAPAVALVQDGLWDAGLLRAGAKHDRVRTARGTGP